MILNIRPRFIFDLVPEDAPPFQIPCPVRAAGSPMILEQCLLLAIGHIVKPRQVFEIGTFKGRTTLVLDMNFPGILPGIRTLDLNPEQADALLEYREVMRLKGHSRQFDFSPYSCECDLIFIDGGHDYETVKSDSANALGMLSDHRAAIVWHDYGNPYFGVTKALDELGESTLLYRIEDTSLVVFAKGWQI